MIRLLIASVCYSCVSADFLSILTHLLYVSYLSSLHRTHKDGTRGRGVFTLWVGGGGGGGGGMAKDDLIAYIIGTKVLQKLE